jgi:hypothetical protein
VDGGVLKTPIHTEADADADGISEYTPITKHRKKREELSSSATKSIKKEFVDIVITFN